MSFIQIYRYLDFDQGSLYFSVFDVTNCFSQDEKLDFQVDFTRKYLYIHLFVAFSFYEVWSKSILAKCLSSKKCFTWNLNKGFWTAERIHKWKILKKKKYPHPICKQTFLHWSNKILWREVRKSLKIEFQFQIFNSTYNFNISIIVIITTKNRKKNNSTEILSG